MNLYVGNLDFEITEDEIKSLFEQVGDVSSVRLMKDKETGRSKGFAFVEMDDTEEAIIALKTLNGREFHGRNIVVNQGTNDGDNKKSFNSNKEGGSRGSYGDGQRGPSRDGDRRSYGNNERKPYSGERQPYSSGERKSYGEDRKTYSGERKPYNSEERRPYNSEERRPSSGNSYSSERRPSSDRPSYDKKPYDRSAPNPFESKGPERTNEYKSSESSEEPAKPTGSKRPRIAKKSDEIVKRNPFESDDQDKKRFNDED